MHARCAIFFFTLAPSPSPSSLACSHERGGAYNRIEFAPIFFQRSKYLKIVFLSLSYFPAHFLSRLRKYLSSMRQIRCQSGAPSPPSIPVSPERGGAPNQRAYFLTFAGNCWLAIRLEFTGIGQWLSLVREGGGLTDCFLHMTPGWLFPLFS